MAGSANTGDRIARNTDAHRQAAERAADEAAKVLPLFESHRPDDDRPRLAIQALLAWIAGARTLSLGEVRSLSLNAHAAARDCDEDAARYAARAAGQAIATWHVPGHATAAVAYAAKAIRASTG